MKKNYLILFFILFSSHVWANDIILKQLLKKASSASAISNSKLCFELLREGLNTSSKENNIYYKAYGTPDYNKQLAEARLKGLIAYLRELGYVGEIKTQEYTYDSKAMGQNSSFNRRIDILL
jgi:hypothetical protein